MTLRVATGLSLGLAISAGVRGGSVFGLPCAGSPKLLSDNSNRETVEIFAGTSTAVAEPAYSLRPWRGGEGDGRCQSFRCAQGTNKPVHPHVVLKGVELSMCLVGGYRDTRWQTSPLLQAQKPTTSFLFSFTSSENCFSASARVLCSMARSCSSSLILWLAQHKGFRGPNAV